MPERKPRERHSDSDGFYLEVACGGAHLWRWKYRDNAKEKRLVIGIYPQATSLQARKARERGKDLLAAGSELMRQIESYPGTPIRVIGSTTYFTYVT